MRLALQSWPKVEAYLQRSRLIVIPVGSTEQHGPNGLIGTDFITAKAVAERAGDRTDSMVAPPICVGMALHHMAFPGTITYRPETLIAVISDYVTSLHRHGFRGFVFVNGHGGNIATANVALSKLREDLPEARFRWLNWYMATSVSRRAKELYGNREGSHATPSEVAVTMAVFPEAVEPLAGPMDIESCASRGTTGSEQFREWYPDGRMGSDPSMARAEHGEELLELAATEVAGELDIMSGYVEIV